MPKQLRVEVVINKGNPAILLPKLASIIAEVQVFLSMLSRDLELKEDEKPWVGLDFGTGSVSFTAEKPSTVSIDQIAEFNNAFKAIIDNNPTSRIRKATLVQYARIASPIEAHESVEFGLHSKVIEPEYTEPLFLAEEAQLAARIESPVEWYSLTKPRADDILRDVQLDVISYGSIQGVIHSLFIGSHFQLRELSSGILIRCDYSQEVYPQIAAALQRLNAVIHVYGETTTDMVSRKIERLSVTRVDVASTLTQSEFDELFGSAPNFTGDLSTGEFMDVVRGRAG